MFIIEQLTCSKCNKNYLGKFKVSLEGQVTCADCENIQTYVKPFMQENNLIEQDLFLHFLEQDLYCLYPTVETKKINLSEFLTEQNTIDVYKLYFQGTDLDFVKNVRLYAYHCLDYIDLNLKELSEKAEQFIRTYLELRFKPLTKQYMKKIKKEISSNWMKELLLSI